jgi:hypothetical protein
MHPLTVTITGSFVHKNGRPVQGLVRFTPSRSWVVVDAITWACLAPTVAIEPDGSFVAVVTATDNDSVPWFYIVEAPGGPYDIEVPAGTGYSLRGLLDEHHPGARP